MSRLRGEPIKPQSIFDLPEALQDVLRRYAAGMSYKEIATDRNTSISTVKNQIQDISHRTGERGRRNITRWFAAHYEKG